jgi:hypothetical protein
MRKTTLSATCRWKHNIKMNLRHTGYEGLDWILVGQDIVQRRTCVNTVTKFGLHITIGVFLITYVSVKFSKSNLYRGISCLTERTLS